MSQVRSYKNYALNTILKLSYFFIVISGISTSNAQDDVIDVGPENVYLHTDRSVYFLGEDLWYKAYVLRSSTGLPSNLSNVLYVELISANSQIVARTKVNLESGLGYGDFELTKEADFKTGTYQLRAYTNWNRNYSNDFIFTKTIQILDLLEKVPDTTSIQERRDTTITTNTHAPNRIEVNFFPEGGSLLENSTSVIGFKAVDEVGNPVKIDGAIYNLNDELVTTISSEFAGMGRLQLFPNKGQQYYAKVCSATGTEIIKELPNLLQHGYNISFKKFKEKYIISALTNQETLLENPAEEVRIVLSSRGNPYLEIREKLVKEVTSFTIPKEQLREGITQITLYAKDSKPYSERLIYVEKTEEVNVSIALDKTKYKPGEAVQFWVSSVLMSEKLETANVSISVIDAKTSTYDDESGNIYSYFFLESDLHGKIFRPNYYFNPENKKRLEHLDNLLLTQGWRDFIWKKGMIKKDTNLFKAEKGFTFSGRVRRFLKDEALSGSNITLGLANAYGFKALSTITDSLGLYTFENLVFFGRTNAFLNATNEKGKPRGILNLDPIEKDPLPTFFKSQEIKRPQEYKQLVNNVYQKFEGFGVPPENILDTVLITKKKSEDLDIFYGAVDYTYTADEKTEGYNTIYDVLSEVPGLIVVDRAVEIAGEDGTPLILIDDYANSAALKFVNPEEVVKIEVIRFSEFLLSIYGEESRGGIISIFTNGVSRMNKPKKGSLSSIHKKVSGFYEAREFYKEMNAIDDFDYLKTNEVRNTIFWSPYINLNSTKTYLTYKNIEAETTIRITLEGITSEGVPIIRNKEYEIEE